MDVLKSNRPLIVYLDVKSPYAFVSVKPTLALERELELQFDWRPYTLDIPSYLGSARKKTGRWWSRAGAAGQYGMLFVMPIWMHADMPNCKAIRSKVLRKSGTPAWPTWVFCL